MRNSGLDEAQAGIKIARRNINNLRHAVNTTLMAESEEELKSLLMKVKEESEKVGLKLNIHSRKVPQTPAPATSKRGRNAEEPAALLGVRTGPKARRAVGESFFKLWESEEKLTSRNTPPAVRKTKGRRNSEKSRPIPTGGRRQGEGQRANSAPEKPPPPTRQAGPGSCLKTSSGSLRPWREGARSARGESAPSLWLPGQDTAKAPHTQRQLPAEPRPPRPRTELN